MLGISPIMLVLCSTDIFDFVVAIRFTKPILKKVLLGKNGMATIFS